MFRRKENIIKIAENTLLQKRVNAGTSFWLGRLYVKLELQIKKQKMETKTLEIIAIQKKRGGGRKRKKKRGKKLFQLSASWRGDSCRGIVTGQEGTNKKMHLFTFKTHANYNIALKQDTWSNNTTHKPELRCIGKLGRGQVTTRQQCWFCELGQIQRGRAGRVAPVLTSPGPFLRAQEMRIAALGTGSKFLQVSLASDPGGIHPTSSGHGAGGGWGW